MRYYIGALQGPVDTTRGLGTSGLMCDAKWIVTRDNDPFATQAHLRATERRSCAPGFTSTHNTTCTSASPTGIRFANELNGKYIVPLPHCNPTLSAPCTQMSRTLPNPTGVDSRSTLNVDPLAFPRTGAWLPSDLAVSCGIDGEGTSLSPEPPSSHGRLDIWNSVQTPPNNEMQVDDTPSQLVSLNSHQANRQPSTTPSSPFPPLNLEPSGGWPSTPENRAKLDKSWLGDKNRPPSAPPAPREMLPAGEGFPSNARWARPETTTPKNSPRAPEAGPCTLVIERLDGNVTEEDIERHFTNPPEWPTSHPIRRAYTQVSEKMGTFLPLHPQAFGVQSVRLTRSPNLQAEVRFVTSEDAERALVEMQHSMLVPQRTPWRSIRVSLSTTATAGAERRQRPGRIQRSATAPTEPTRRPGPKRRTSDSQASRGRPGSTSPQRVPTTLTFVQDEDSEGKPAAGAPMLASALAVAHTSSALDPNNTTVFVGSLFSMASEATLYSLFSPFGPILSVNIPRGQDCGFVQFAHKEDAARAIAEMQNCPVAGGSLRLSWGRSVGEKAAARAATRAGLRWVEDAS